MGVRIVSWNIAKMHEPWRQLLNMDVDVALLQEAGMPPEDVAGKVDTGPAEHWDSHHWNSRWYEGRFKNLLERWPKVVKLSDRVEIEWFKQVSPISQVNQDELAVSGIGTIAAARVLSREVSPFIVVSMYARWLSPHPSVDSNWIISDASAHRIISDLSMFIGRENGHRILASGDLNLLYGTAEGRNEYWAQRYATVFDRMETIGLPLVGPRAPHGQQADPWPSELPSDSRNVPTFRSIRNPPTRQLDFVFASKEMVDNVRVKALNGPEEWGPSDHCRVLIEVIG